MRVFISSTYVDLTEYRAKVAEAVERLGQHGIRMEVFGARSETATSVCSAEIDEADLFVGVYAHRYGFIPKGSHLSITEMEFDYAVARGKPVFCFVVEEDLPWRPTFIEHEPGRSKLQAFKDKLSARVVYETFTTPHDLGFKVAASLGRYLITSEVRETLDRAAKTKQGAVGTETSRDRLARRAERLSPLVRGGRILLVDDSPYQLEYASEILGALGVRIATATDTEQALSLLSAEEIDVVISDVRRGHNAKAGLEMLGQIRQRGLLRPVIFYVADYQPALGTPPYAFGITNKVDELLNLTFDAFERLRG